MLRLCWFSIRNLVAASLKLRLGLTPYTVAWRISSIRLARYFSASSRSPLPVLSQSLYPKIFLSNYAKLKGRFIFVCSLSCVNFGYFFYNMYAYLCIWYIDKMQYKICECAFVWLRLFVWMNFCENSVTLWNDLYCVSLIHKVQTFFLIWIIFKLYL